MYNIVSLGKVTEKTEPFQEDKLNMNFQANIWKIQLLRKSAAILHDVK